MAEFGNATGSVSTLLRALAPNPSGGVNRTPVATAPASSGSKTGYLTPGRVVPDQTVLEARASRSGRDVPRGSLVDITV